MLLLTSHMLGELTADRRLRLHRSDRLEPEQLPGTLDNYSLRFQLTS